MYQWNWVQKHLLKAGVTLVTLILIVVMAMMDSASSAQAINTQLLWYGQPALKLSAPSDRVLLIDPWLSNPLNLDGMTGLVNPKQIDFVPVTHDHLDQLDHAVEIAKLINAKLVRTSNLGQAIVSFDSYPRKLATFEAQESFGGELNLLSIKSQFHTANVGEVLNLANSTTDFSVLNSDQQTALDQTLPPDEQTANRETSAHDHVTQLGAFELYVELNNITNAATLDPQKVGKQGSFMDSFGDRGDYMNPGAGNNTVIASGGHDIIRSTGKGLNTITTGTGNDTIILGQETTNRIFDFDPAYDHFVLQGIKPQDITLAQGTNPGKGGLQQPLDSVNNALVINWTTGRILASLPFVRSTSISESNFFRLTGAANQSLSNESLKALGFKNQQGNGQLNGTQGHDCLIGGKGNDFLCVGNDGFKFDLAQTTSGAGEFPFPNDSTGSSEIQLSLKDGVLAASGSYKGFNASPLFSQSERAIAPNAKILNSLDPVAMIKNFLKVPQDKEGNPISGKHLHFSPAGDHRGNFADATIVRYFTSTIKDARSGTIAARFHLSPEEQAALLAGDLYVNIHTNINNTGDGKPGFPTGENRINFNQNVVQFVSR